MNSHLPIGIEDLLGGAVETARLERVTQMDAPPTRTAWAWFDLGRARRWLRAPRGDVIDALQKACELDRHQDRFRRELEKELNDT